MSFQLRGMIKERKNMKYCPDILTVKHVALIHNHKRMRASRALRDPSSPIPALHPTSLTVTLNRHHLQMIWKMPPVVKTQGSMSYFSLCFFPYQTFFIFLLILSRLALAQSPGTSTGQLCWQETSWKTNYPIQAERRYRQRGGCVAGGGERRERVVSVVEG